MSKIINLLDNTPYQASKFRTKNRVDLNNDPRGTHITNSQIRFEYFMLKLNLYVYSDA